MAVEDAFDFDRRYVLAARNDDVLRAVLQFDIAVGVHDPEIAGAEPAAGKGLLGGVRVLEVSFHDGISAHHHFTHGCAVSGNRNEARRVGDSQSVEHRIGNTLPCLEPCPFGGRQLVPFITPSTNDGGTIDLGQTVDMGDMKPELPHPLDDRGRRRRARCHHLDAPVQRTFQTHPDIEEHIHDHWSTT